MPKPFAISLGLPFAEAIAQAAGRGVTLPADYYGRLPSEARSQAFTVSTLTSLEQIKDVLDSLVAALQDGQTFAQWKEAIGVGLGGLADARKELIFRNAVQTGYNVGRTTQQRENKARRPYYMWDAINDTRTRPAHAAMDGYIAPIDDAIWTRWSPPAGHNCRCTRISLTEAQAKARGYGRQPRPSADPDPGWDYEKADGQGAALGTALANKAAQLPAAVQAAVRAFANPAPAPQGVPVSRALLMPSGRTGAAKELREALAAIDSVHGDGALPAIPVELSRTGRALGQYRFMPMVDRSVDIKVSRTGTHQRLTFAHEVGHFLDHKGWGGSGFAAGSDPAAKAWRDAVINSPEVQRLAELRRTNPGQKWYRYATRFDELWARSYAQWVAVRSGDQVMLDQLIKIKTDPNSEGYRLSQWGTVEFGPIAKAIDDLFAMLGWRHP